MVKRYSKVQEVTALQVLLALFNKKAMPKYSTEIRQAPKEQYIKVFLADNSEMQDAKERLELVHSVRKVNVSNDNRDLTIYVKPPFSAKEAEEQVKKALEQFYDNSGISRSTVEDAKGIRDTLPANSKVRKCYDDALAKMVEAKYERNNMDDIRLALELYLKEVLGNDKPLEKQASSLKDYYTKKKVSNELISTHTQSLHHLCDFFNNHAKHDYNVKREEIDSVVGYVNQIMKSLINISE